MTAWESRGAFGQLLSGVMGSMIAKDEEQRDAHKAQFAQKMEEKAEEERREKEVSILIKAKLIHMKDAAMAKDAADFITQ